jgi:subtilisin family serine protease
MRRIFVGVLMALACSFWVGAQETVPIQLDERTAQQLAQGQRTRVVVEFAVRSAESNGLEISGPSLPELIDNQSARIIRSAFGREPDSLRRLNVELPQLRRVFRHTPAMAIEVNQSELNALARTSAVTRISSDSLERQFLNQSLRQIEALELQSAGHRGANTTIAILDGGIHYDHPAFDGRIIESGCFSSNLGADGSTSLCPNGVSQDVTSDDAARPCTNTSNNECVHGTHVASIAAGAQNLTSPLGQYYSNGVAPDSSIIPVQVFSQFSGPSACDGGARCLRSYISDQLAALEWLYDNRATTNLTAINMSLGGEYVSGACPTDVRASIIAQLRAAGIATVIASGNHDLPYGVTTPGCIEDAITVAGVNHQLRLSGNYGPLVDFVAPEAAIAAGRPTVQNLTINLSGTSIATPHVTGAFAVLRAAVPDASVGEIERALRDTAVAVNNPAGDDHQLIQLLPAYLVLADDVIEIEEPDSTHYARQYNSTGITTDPVAYRFTNNGSRPEPWQIEFDIDQDTLVTFSGGASVRNSSNWNFYSGTIDAGETMTVWIDPEAEFDGGSQSFDFIGGGLAYTGQLTFEVFFPRPANDNLFDARIIRDTEFSIFSRTGVASYQAGEPRDPDYTGSVWYVWRPQDDAALKLTSTSPFFVYSGSIDNLLNLVEIRRSNNSGNSEHYADIDVEASNGYLIRMLVKIDDDQNYAQFSLNSRDRDLATQGDGPSNPRPLSGISGVFIGTIHQYAFSEILDDDPFGQENGYQLWFQWIAPYSGNFVVSNQSPIWRTGLGWAAPEGSLGIYRRIDGASEHGSGDAAELLERIAYRAFDAGPTDTWEQRRISADVEQGNSYWIRFTIPGAPGRSILTFGQQDQRSSRLFGAVLPAHRNVRDGNPITAFMSLVNPASQPESARNCRIEPIGYAPNSDTRLPYRIAANFQYQATNAANIPDGSPNQLFDIDPGGVQSFIISFDPVSLMDREVLLTTICDNLLPDFAQRDTFGTVSFVTVDRAVSDIISIAVSPTNNGIIELSNGQTRAFSVAAVNIGEDGSDIEVRAYRSQLDDFSPPPDSSLTFEICETEPATGLCVTQRSNRLNVNFGPGEVRTFTVFVRAEAMHEFFSPRNFRAVVRFATDDFDGTENYLRSETSVAIRTLGD